MSVEREGNLMAQVALRVNTPWMKTRFGTLQITTTRTVLWRVKLGGLLLRLGMWVYPGRIELKEET